MSFFPPNSVFLTRTESNRSSVDLLTPQTVCMTPVYNYRRLLYKKRKIIPIKKRIRKGSKVPDVVVADKET
jgi:hypothetical protein